VAEGLSGVINNLYQAAQEARTGALVQSAMASSMNEEVVIVVASITQEMDVIRQRLTGLFKVFAR
jgi:hypothetical protein